MTTRTGLLLLGTASLLACSTLVGADFDDRNLGEPTTGGTVASTGGASNGGQAAGGAASGGASPQGTGGVSNGGASNGGSTVVGSGGATGGNAGQADTGGSSGGARTTGGTSAGGAAAGQGGIGPAGSGGQEPEGGVGGVGGVGGFGGQGGAGGESEVAGAGGEAGNGGVSGGAPVVVLNEVKGQGSGDDFMEIVNRGPGALNLEGYGLSDQNNTFIFPSGATIPEGGYVLLLLGQTTVTGNFTCFTPNPCFHATWGISQNGETVYFRGRQNQVLDSTTYPSQTGTGALTNEQTWGRIPNGSGAFRATRPTPEAANQSSP